MTPSAPDFAFSSEWRSMVATTSSGVISLPSWNCTPLRILNVHTLASSEAPHSSASAGFDLAVGGEICTSCSPHWRPKIYGTWLAQTAGSRLSVAAPPCMPALQDAALLRSFGAHGAGQAACWRLSRSRRGRRPGRENRAGSSCPARRDGRVHSFRQTYGMFLTPLVAVNRPIVMIENIDRNGKQPARPNATFPGVNGTPQVDQSRSPVRRARGRRSR